MTQTGRKRVFITGAAGQTGIQVLNYLNKHTDKIEVHAGIHTNKKEEQMKRLKSLSITTHDIDADDISSTVEAMKGCDAVFIIPSATEDKVHHGQCYIQAAKKANVGFVLLLSMVGVDHSDYLFADQFRALEESLERLKIPKATILRSQFYAQNLLLYRDQIKQGHLPLPIGEGKFPAIDVEDVGRAAKEILLDPERQVGKTYELTGPVAMTGEKIAQIFSSALDYPVKYQDCDPAKAKKLLQTQGLPASEVQGLLEFYELVKQGDLQHVSQDVETITGDIPSTLEDFVNKHKDELKREA